MKVVAFNGSARKEGNTALLINKVLLELKQEGIEIETFNLCGKKIRGCIACRKCYENKDQLCSINNDILNECLDKMLKADGIILGTPTYFSDVSTEMKALIDRTGFVAKVNGDLLKRKVGAAVVAVRRAGSIHAFDSMNHLFTISEMVVVGSSYWNMGFGSKKGDVKEDTEGLKTMRDLGQNMAWVMKRLYGNP